MSQNRTELHCFTCGKTFQRKSGPGRPAKECPECKERDAVRATDIQDAVVTPNAADESVVDKLIAKRTSAMSTHPLRHSEDKPVGSRLDDTAGILVGDGVRLRELDAQSWAIEKRIESGAWAVVGYHSGLAQAALALVRQHLQLIIPTAHTDIKKLAYDVELASMRVATAVQRRDMR